MPQLKKVEFDCTVITPMFLAGAHQNKPELRVPSLRGELRWWLRALLGATSVQSAAGLFEEEKKVFGSVDAISAVSVRLSVVREASSKAGDLFQQYQQMQGMRYLWYSTNLGQNNRPYFEPENTQFKVSFISKDDAALKKAVCALWALSICGGLGTRSRRGAGSFSAEITRSDIDQDLLPKFNANIDPQNFGEQFSKVEQIFGGFSSSGVQKDWASFSKVKIFRTGINAQSWQDAVNQVGNACQNFRNRRQPDYQSVRNFIQNHTVPQNIERAAFGLPLMFRYRTLPRNANSAIVSVNLDSDRRASPLWISIVRLPDNRDNRDNRYDAILTFFESLFLPKNSGLTIKSGRQNPQLIPGISGTSIIQTFIEDKFPKKQVLLQR